MKRRILIALAVALLLGLGAPAGLADSRDRPFKGRVPGADSWVIDTCSEPGPLDVPCIIFGVEGTIIATHLGKGIYTALCSIDFENGVWDPEPPIIRAPLLPGSTFTFEAANGDKLYGSLTGHCWWDLGTYDNGGTFQGEFTGGTGRFEGAEGTVVKTFWGHSDPAEPVGVVSSSWEGWIGY